MINAHRPTFNEVFLVTIPTYDEVLLFITALGNVLTMEHYNGKESRD